MIIYLDILFFENLMINFIIEILTGKIRKIKYKKIRIIISSCAGALYVVIKAMLNINDSLVERLICSVLMIILAFYPLNVRKLLKTLVILLVVTFVIGGIDYSLIDLINIKNFNITILSAVTGVILILSSFKNNKGNITKSDFFVDLEIYISNTKYKVKGYVDSGNFLKDPITKKDVVIIQKNIMDKSIKGVIPIPLKTVGSDKNIIWSICPEKVFIISDGNKKQVDCLLGLYEGKFSNGCEALVGYNLIN